MSNSAEKPSSSSVNDTELPLQGTISPPPIQSLPPPFNSSLINGGGTTANASAVPPSNGGGGDSPPPPLSSSPPLSLESPPPSPPQSPPPSEKNPPPSQSQPPPTTTSPAPPLSTSPPPSSPQTFSPPPLTSSHSPPPTPAGNGSPPVAGHSSPPPPSSPDKFLTPPLPPNGIVSPPSEGSRQQSPPPPTEFLPPLPIPAHVPPTITSPLTPSAVSPPTQSVSGGSTPNRSGAVASPLTRNSTASTTTLVTRADGSENAVALMTKAVAGVVVASVVFVTIIAIFFGLRKKRKRQDLYGSHYMPPANNFTVKTDGYYYGQQPQSMGFSGQANHSYVSNYSLSPLGDSYGSQRGNMNNGGGPDSGVIGGTKTSFSYEQMMEITNGFSRQNVIGEGGFGCVYKGWMPDGKVVAVKQLKAGSGQGDREFKAEVEIISRVHHRHLVSLVGYCISDNQRLLIYEFVPNKTLEHHLHAKGLDVLDWHKRLKIAIGSAKGLAYLHEDCHPKIFHRDIKSANILLDDAFEAQVADFGLARLNDSTQTHVSTRVMGTFGYLAPEYASSGKLTDRSDVYSFGVVLLELITGRKPIDATQPLGDESLVEWARPLLIHALESGDLGELVDPRFEKHYVESEMLRMIETAAACVRHSAPKRPRMAQVVRALDSDGEMSDLSNGVKYGQSTTYDSGQYNEEIMKFRRMALGDGSTEFNAYSGEYASKDMSRGPPVSGGYTSGESETRAMNPPGPHQQSYDNSGNQTNYTTHRFI